MKPKKKKFKRHFSEKKNTGSKSRKGYKRSNYSLNDGLEKDALDMSGDYLFKDDEGI